MQSSKLLELNSNLAHIEAVSKKKTRKERSLDLLSGCLVFLEIALFLAFFNLIFSWHLDEELSGRYLFLLGLILIVYFTQVMGKGLFRLKSPYSWVGELFQLIQIAFLTFMIMAGLLFLLKMSLNYSRVVIGLFFVGMLVSSWLLRLMKRGILAWLVSSNILSKNVLIIGAGKVGQNLYSKLAHAKGSGYHIIGFLDDNKQGNNIKGSLSETDRIINQYEVDEIIVTIPSERKYIYELLRNIQKYKVNVKIIPELYDLVTTKVAYDQVDSFPFVEVSNLRIKRWHGVGKRMLDIVLSGGALIVLLPVFALLYAAVKISSPGPAVFRQVRIGKDGSRFYIYKFRSMVIDAEKKLKEDPELYKKYVENNYKLEPDQDPRITKLGRFLRKTSLDELPQLFNVIKGEMSLVGPRPVVEDELQEYDQLIFDFLSVKPGITGYWQVSGRSEAGYPERVDIELYYVYNQSLSLDIKILFKTVTAVLNRKGAY